MSGDWCQQIAGLIEFKDLICILGKVSTAHNNDTVVPVSEGGWHWFARNFYITRCCVTISDGEKHKSGGWVSASYHHRPFCLVLRNWILHIDSKFMSWQTSAGMMAVLLSCIQELKDDRKDVLHRMWFQFKGKSNLVHNAKSWNWIVSGGIIEFSWTTTITIS